MIALCMPVIFKAVNIAFLPGTVDSLLFIQGHSDFLVVFKERPKDPVTLGQLYITES